MDFKMRKRQEFAMEEYRKCKKLVESGDMTKETFKKNFRGAVALRTGKAYTKIDQRYRAWLKSKGLPMPKPRVTKKKSKKSKKKEKEDKQ